MLQQGRASPGAGSSRGCVVYWTWPVSRGVVQVWHTPVRQDQRVGMSHASASSSSVECWSDQRVDSPLRAKVTKGPVPWGPGGW
jgi:hypothetical protein